MENIYTLDNLVHAYLGESQARNRYSFYASIAKKEGYEQIAGIFRETAEQEKEHASNLFKLIVRLQEELKVGAKIVADEVGVPSVLGATLANLEAAIEGENYEADEMYPNFADVAEEEGYKDIAVRLRAIARAEDHHSQTYTALLDLVKSDDGFFKRPETVIWVCRECGYLHVGKEAPVKCPSCDHAQAYFETYQKAF